MVNMSNKVESGPLDKFFFFEMFYLLSKRCVLSEVLQVNSALWAVPTHNGSANLPVTPKTGCSPDREDYHPNNWSLESWLSPVVYKGLLAWGQLDIEPPPLLKNRQFLFTKMVSFTPFISSAIFCFLLHLYYCLLKKRWNVWTKTTPSRDSIQPCLIVISEYGHFVRRHIILSLFSFFQG